MDFSFIFFFFGVNDIIDLFYMTARHPGQSIDRKATKTNH